MRAVFQPPASIVSVVLAPAAVSSLESPTRPEWAVTPSTPAALAAAAKRRPMLWPFNPRKTSASDAALAGRSAVSAVAALAQQRRPRVCREHHRLDRKCMAMAAPGSDRCTRHHLEALTDRRALKPSSPIDCADAALNLTPDTAPAPCVGRGRGGRSDASATRRCAWITARSNLSVATLTTATQLGAVRESGARRRLGGETEGMAATPEASCARCYRGPERRCRQLRSPASRGRCASGGTHPRRRARSPGAHRTDRLARSRGSRAQAKATHAAASHGRRRAPRRLARRCTIEVLACLPSVLWRACTP